MLSCVDQADISGKEGAPYYEYPDLTEYRPKKDESLVYDEPDSVQQHKTKYLQLNENPAYGKQGRKADIKLEDCPAYMEQKKDQSIKIEECLAYEEQVTVPGIKLEECPAYGKRTMRIE